MTDVVKLVICEDQRSYRKLLAGHFEALDSYEVKTASTIEELEEVVGEWHPDVVLFDLYLQDVARFDGARKIRTLSPATKVIVLSYSPFEGDVRRALEGDGATTFDSYLTKDIDLGEIEYAITRTLAGYSYIDPAVGQHLRHDPASDLSASELRVLQGLADGKTLREIARLLPRSSKTGLPVGDRHLRRLIHEVCVKLGAKSQTEAISIAHRRRLIS